MFRQFSAWLGVRRAVALLGALIVMLAGLVAAQLAVDDADTRLSVQLALVWVFSAALGLALSTRLTGQARQRLWLALGPGLVLVGLGVFLPTLGLFFGGAGLGWMITGQFVLRGRVRMEYQSAVKLMRKGEHTQAIGVLDQVIRAEPDVAEHHRFRADLHRLAGEPDKAMKDYRRVVQLAPNTIAGYVGLAETAVLRGRFDEAHEYAQQALVRDRGGWMAAYNLGMIEDRRAEPQAAVQYLERAIAAGIPHARFRVMAHLWRARSYARLGHREEAMEAMRWLRREAKALHEWELIMQSTDAAALRDLLADDIALIRRVLESSDPLDDLSR